jgi:hypothetical protein
MQLPLVAAAVACRGSPTSQAGVGGKQNEGLPGPLLKGDSPTGPYLLRQRTQYANWIGKKLEYVPTNQCVERCVARELSNIGLSEPYVMQSCLGRASLRAIDRASVTLDRYNLS